MKRFERKTRTLRFVAFVAFGASLALGAALGCGSEHALVGGRCKEGLLALDGTCVRPGTSPTIEVSGTEPPEDPELASGVVPAPPVFAFDAAPNATWEAGVPLDPPDADARDAPDAPDADTPDVNTPDASLPDANAPDAPPVCAAPLVACRGQCISVTSDPLNCGACGKVCPSNICVAGECQGETPGDVVLVGSAFEDAWGGSAEAKVLLNAVSIATTDPIRVLTWETGASAPSVTNVKTMLGSSLRGRGIAFTAANDASALADQGLAIQYDVVLLFDAAGADPSARGASWATGLGRFAEKGGVVVALDGQHGGMPALVTATGLLSVPAHTELAAGAHLAVAAPNDVIGQQVLSPYATSGAAIVFPGASAPSADVTWVVRAGEDGGLGAPHVVHRTVR